MTAFDWTIIGLYILGMIGLSAYLRRGLTWLQYELALPLAIIFTMVFLLPFFRKLELVSVYEYTEFRFGLSARLAISGVFLS